MAGGQISPSLIDFHRRPYNTLALPCERVITLLLNSRNVIRGRIHDMGVKPATDESGYPAGLHVSAALTGSTTGKESRKPTAMNVDHFTSY